MANCHHTCHECEAWSDLETIKSRLEKFVTREDSGCWIWSGTKNPRGYGQINIGRAPTYVHRIAVVLDGRDIPEGMEVDHLCRTTSCVNPDHLEVVTPTENRQRAARARRNRPAIETARGPGASGVLGVTWHKGKQRWRVRISGRQIGEYRELADAERAATHHAALAFPEDVR